MADQNDFAAAVGALIKSKTAAAKTYTDEQLAAQKKGWAIEQSAFDDGLYVIVDGGQLTPASTGLYKIGA